MSGEMVSDSMEPKHRKPGSVGEPNALKWEQGKEVTGNRVGEWA